MDRWTLCNGGGGCLQKECVQQFLFGTNIYMFKTGRMLTEG